MTQIDADARSEGRCGYNGDDVRHPCKFDEGWGTEWDSGFCTYHNDSGAPPENQNAVGNDGGDGAPEGHFRSLKTGDNVAVDRWIEYIDEHADNDFRDMFAGWVEHFREQGADRAASVRLAILWSKADYNNMELIEKDFTRPLYHEGVRVGEIFDVDRDSSAIQNEREARLYRREDELSPHSQSESRQADALEGGLDLTLSVEDKDALEDAFDT